MFMMLQGLYELLVTVIYLSHVSVCYVRWTLMVYESILVIILAASYVV